MILRWLPAQYRQGKIEAWVYAMLPRPSGFADWITQQTIGHA
jgi:hypothetical protein